ncbi:uncharacterized protein LOC114872324 [Osmia bicornis bicornis]|uniref:uncharacterized protein LOC114872324 n=1 Tax=Osmia bicornis bicornis TaxID=1437191 RepID=UPI0010F5B62E|nr:uncharacterized protein LOC114872324 [Osmia bicornis bicornis]
MWLFKYLFLLVLNKIVVNEAVHLKIYVPDVVNHHFHTKTVLLHVHKPAPKKPKHHKKHEYHANWSSWKSYGNDHTFKDHQEFPEELEEPKHEVVTKKPKDQKDRQKYLPVYGYHKDSYFPPSYMEDNDLEEKGRQRGKGPSYAVHEEVNDIPPNTESFSYNYEEGYRKGLQEEAGHIRADQMSKFHEDHQEEQDDSENEGSRDEYEGKTDAGRYFVDDVEYENTRDKRDGRAGRFRRIIKI